MAKIICSQLTHNYFRNTQAKAKILLCKLLVKLVLLYHIKWKEFPLVSNKYHHLQQHCNQHCTMPTMAS